MPMIRPTALRGLQSTLRYSGARITARAAPARTQLVAKRFASSGGHGGHGEASSDLPWLLAALAITPPSCWYLWPDQSSHGHGDHGAHGEKHHEEKSEEPSGEEEQGSGGEQEAVEEVDEKKEDKPEVKDEGKQEEKKDDKSDEKSEEKSDDKPEEKKDEGKSEEKKDEGKSEDKSEDKSEGKGEKKDKDTGAGEEKGRTFTVGAKSEGKEGPPESEGSASTTTKTGQKLGEGNSNTPSSGPRGKSQGDISVKQAGMSNTDTKHSIPIDSSTEKSTKGDGSPETSKSKATVDPKGPVK